MPLINYWPTRDEINRCIKTEAESAPDAVLLSVHQPMTLLRRDEGSKKESEVTEHELLKAFLTDDLPQGTLIMPVTGPSGAGKSHLIRWLHAQLKRDDPRSERRHVIRVPKSASLRNVVELILNPLSEDPKFSEIGERLKKSVAEVNPAEAAISFAGKLEISLNRLHTRLLNELKSDPGRSNRDELRSRANHAKQLPGFFNDSTLRQHFIDDVLAPIIERAVSGRSEEVVVEDEFLPQFQSEDLRVPDNLRSQLGKASQPVQLYYKLGLNAKDGEGRKQAAGVLNEVVDEAIQQVFQLDQLTGGITLEEIILRVREVLFEQGRELVLLVEDFVALSGIQQVLLKVCIQEAERDGRQVRSVMRTALALTDGYLVARDTIATRAKQEWVIQPVNGEDDVVGRTIELVGAYLNAARWGADPLNQQYLSSPRVSEADLTSWVSIYSDEDMGPQESDFLTCLGQSNRGVPLFPYNRSAIGGLADRHLRIGGELHYNPRRVINFILRDVLLSGREDFAKGQFPQPGFEGASAHPVIKSKLREVVVSESERQRIEALLKYWGGDPSDLFDLSSISEAIFTVFGLTPPNIGEVHGKKTAGHNKSSTTNFDEKERQDKKKQRNEQNERKELASGPDVSGWSEALRNWVDGNPLLQSDARKIRIILTPLVEKAVPWNSLRLTKRNLNWLLTIPNAGGNEASASFRVALAEDSTDPDGELYLTLLGALRLNATNWDLNYPEADEDSARVSNLVERLAKEVIENLKTEREKEVLTLSWLLYRQAMILGLGPHQRMTRVEAQVFAIRNGLAHEGTEQSGLIKLNDGSRWDELRKEASELRQSIQAQLWERIGCYQGDSGRTVLAIDPTLIKITDDIDSLIPKFSSEKERSHFSQLKPVFVRPTVRPLLDQLRTLAAKVHEALGPEIDKVGFLSGLMELQEKLISIGGWPKEIKKTEIRQQIEAFRNDDLKKQLDGVSPLLADTNADIASSETLGRLGRLDLAVIERATSFMQLVETFLRSVEQEIELKERELNKIDPESDAKDLSRLLNEIERDLRYTAGKGQV
jgi:hypothetical protein